MQNARKIAAKAAPTVESRKVEIPFAFETLEDLIATVGENVFGYAPGKIIVRIPADTPLPEGAKESAEMVSAWNLPRNTHALRGKFVDWKRKEATR